MATFEILKDPDAVLPYKFDFANTTNGGDQPDWLAVGETISTHTITADTGITDDGGTITDSGTSVTVWLSGGTAGVDYDVSCKIVTSAGKEEKRTTTFLVGNR